MLPRESCWLIYEVGSKLADEAEKTGLEAGAKGWGMALALTFTFWAVILAGWSIPVWSTRWGFWVLIAFAYLFLAMGFLGIYVEVNRLLSAFSMRFRRTINLVVTLVAVAVCVLSYSFLGDYTAARWIFGTLLAIEAAAVLVLLGGIGAAIDTRARNYVLAFIPAIIAGFFLLGWLAFAALAARIAMGVFCALALMVAAVFLAKGFQVTLQRSATNREAGVAITRAPATGSRLAASVRTMRKVAGFVAFLLGVAAAVATIYAAFTQGGP